MEKIILGLFCLSLLICIIFNKSVLYALLSGLILFLFYGRQKNFSWSELWELCFSGIKTIKNVLVTFILIGMLTASWRSAGTIPVIMCFTVKLINPLLFLLMTFLLNCLISVLTGTAFGTAATMGVICASVGSSIGISSTITAGAILAGVYFGDRCSPVSTSAQVVAELTGTNIFTNIKRMAKSSAVPFILTCAIYFVMGFFFKGNGDIPDLAELFGSEFNLNLTAVLPAVVIAVLSLLQVNVKIAMSASILTALPICFFMQGVTLSQIPCILISGYNAANPEIARLLNGGGIMSMLNVTIIVLISASYSGLFDKTGLLDNVQKHINKVKETGGSFIAVLLTAISTSIISCSQTLAIMMTQQLAGSREENQSDLALNMEDTVIVISPLVPWSISAAVPLASVGGSAESVIFAFYLFLVPFCRFCKDAVKLKKAEKNKGVF